MDIRIPFNRPPLVGRELLYVAQAVLEGHTAGNGPFGKRCEAMLAEQLGSPTLLTSSASTALEMAALLADVGPGDEVVLPSYAFVTCVNAFVLRGATPVFVEIRPDTLNLDETQLERALTPRTKAILALHYGGVACALEPILALARERGVLVIEDAAQGLGATYQGRPLGTLGQLGVLSFHETKNVICGEGGALVVNDPALLERAEILREKGTDRARFFRGEVDKYTWQDVGSSWVPSDLLAAFLCAQLEEAERLSERRRALWSRYREGLADLAAAGQLTLPTIPADCVANGHLFFFLARDLEQRTRLLQWLRSRGILAVFHYVPLHNAPAAARFAPKAVPLPVTEALAERVVRLPLYYDLSDAEHDEVLAAVRAFYADEPG